MSMYTLLLGSAVRGGRRRVMTHCSRLSTNAKYDHKAIDRKWQTYWEENQTFRAPLVPSTKKKYILDMFPYPSGSGLHVGHPEGYTATDIVSRYWRMKGFDVLHPMGWDAFGLPAEQHAINTGEHPGSTTAKNIATFKRQLKEIGFSYDWSRELSTTDDNYVRWTQWIFLQLFNQNLAYQSEASVNWCPALGTVLANEEVIDGLSERGSHPVVRRPIRQWMLRITAYADALERGLDGLAWPEGTMNAQRRWIGTSEGVIVNFSIHTDAKDVTIEVFTTRPDTLLGVTYIVLAPEHELVRLITASNRGKEVSQYVEQASSKSDVARMSTKEKSGVWLGCFASHPLTGEQVPVWCADYVLSGYGTGAVMAVPAHDIRDFEFANLFNLPVRCVVRPKLEDSLNGEVSLPFTDHGVSCNSGNDLDGLPSKNCSEVIISKLVESGKGRRKTMYKLRDWVFSRQRYWGEPIPIYFPVEFNGAGDPATLDPRDPNCKHRVCYESPIPLKDEELPLLLPDLTDFTPKNDPQGCLAQVLDWKYFKRNGNWFARETSTMPQWAGSCWYYIRFADPKNSSALLSESAQGWLPVDLYVGGQEHAVLHLLYARFWHKVLHKIGAIKESEPFPRLVHQGMILGSDGEKMSKSRGNVINPDEIVNEFGADSLRLYEMFMGPLEAVKPWQTEQVQGVVRFRDRVFNLISNKKKCTRKADALYSRDNVYLRAMHRTINKVTQDIENLSFNTAISALMVYSNLLSDGSKDNDVPDICYDNLILLLSPFAPHVSEECWQLLGHNKTLAYHPWPEFDPTMCEEESATISVQVNGKLRATLNISKSLTRDEVVSLATGKVEKYLTNEKVKKTIYVPQKIVNLVLDKK